MAKFSFSGAEASDCPSKNTERFVTPRALKPPRRGAPPKSSLQANSRSISRIVSARLWTHCSGSALFCAARAGGGRFFRSSGRCPTLRHAGRLRGRRVTHRWQTIRRLGSSAGRPMSSSGCSRRLAAGRLAWSDQRCSPRARRAHHDVSRSRASGRADRALRESVSAGPLAASPDATKGDLSAPAAPGASRCSSSPSEGCSTHLRGEGCQSRLPRAIRLFGPARDLCSDKARHAAESRRRFRSALRSARVGLEPLLLKSATTLVSGVASP